LPQELYTELLHRLARLRVKREAVALRAAVLNAATSVILLAILAVVIEMLGHLGIPQRTFLFWAWALISIILSAAFVLPHLLERFGITARTSDDELAAQIGRHYPAVEDRLLNGLQLARPLFAEGDVQASGAAASGAAAFSLAAFQSTYTTVRGVDFNAIVDERPARRALVLFLSTLAIAAVLFVSMRTEVLAASDRLLHYTTFYQKPAPFTFVVTPGSTRVMRGDSVQITVLTRGEQLAALDLRMREEGQKSFDRVSVRSEPVHDSTLRRQGFQKVFHYIVRVLHPMEYYAEARDIESERYRFSVLDHPIVRSLVVKVNPPSYTHQSISILPENIGDFSGIAGTRADYRVVASANLARASLVFTPKSVADSAGKITQRPSREISLAVSDSVAAGSLVFLESGSYHLELVDRDSIRSDHPIEYSVTITADGSPSIALIEPESRSDVPSTMRVDMLARVHDDFGFRSVRLAYRLSKSNYGKPDSVYRWLDMPLSNYNAQDLDVPYIWNLTPLALTPEDAVSYYLEVADNDAVSGPKKARTAEYVLRLPSIKEIFERADKEANKADRDLKEIRQDADELQKKVDQALSEMQQMKASDLANAQKDFSSQKDMQQMVERQQQLQQRLDQVASDLKQMSSSMEKQDALSPETMKQYQELQKLFEQINSPELKAALEKLQQSMQQQQVDPKQLQEAMKGLKANEEQFRKSIERTANILKKIQAEQKVDELMKRSGELAKQEQKAADQAADQAQQNKDSKQTPEERAAAERQQQDAQKELDRMQEEAKQLAADMKKLPESMQAQKEMSEMQQALQDPSIQNDMQNAADASKKGDEQRSAQNSQSAANKMKNAQQKLSNLKKQLAENQRQRDMRQMKQLRDKLNQLSKNEEQIRNKAGQAMPNSNVYRDLAEQQAQQKEQLGQTASEAMQMAQRSTAITPEMGKQMGKAFAEMQKAQDAMTERNQPGAQQSSQGAMAALNRAAQQMQQSMNDMAQQGQSGGSGGEGEEGSEGEGSGTGGKSPGKGMGQGSAMQQFLSEINKLSQQQQSLANQAQAMAQGGQGSAQAQKEMMRQQAAMSRMAAQQQAVQKSVEQLADEQKQSQTGNKIAAESLRKIAEDMQEVITQMKTQGIRPETVQRQERILSRLLEAERSVHERDKEEQRESKPGQEIVRESPRDLDLGSPEVKRQIQEELQHARETGYSKDYNELIRKYFESLEKAK
jgi:hypothetical protein